MSKKLKIASGIGAGVVALGVGAMFVLSSPKATFLSRLSANQNLKQATQSYKLSANANTNSPYDELLNSVSVSGIASVDKSENVEATVNVDGLDQIGVSLSELKMVMYKDKLYINVDFITSYLSSVYGTTLNLDGAEFIELSEAIESATGSSSYSDELESSTALQKDLNDAFAGYLKDLDGKKFVKGKNDEVTLKLNRTDIIQLAKVTTKAMIDSKHYKGEKDSLNEFMKSLNSKEFNETLKDEDLNLDISVTYGKKVGDSKAVFEVDANSLGKVDVTFETKSKNYVAPKKPAKVISQEELQIRIEDAVSEMYSDQLGDYTGEDAAQ